VKEMLQYVDILGRVGSLTTYEKPTIQGGVFAFLCAAFSITLANDMLADHTATILNADGLLRHAWFCSLVSQLKSAWRLTDCVQNGNFWSE
jgi:hypothetical protein